jgi:hypothetical protein
MGSTASCVARSMPSKQKVHPPHPRLNNSPLPSPLPSLPFFLQTGRTPLDYVDPRLPGLTELLEAGRQLTPSRPGGPKSTHASAGPSRHHRPSPLHSPAGHIGSHRGGAGAAPASAAGSAAVSPVGGGYQHSRGTGVASPGGGGGGQVSGGACCTPQRRGSSVRSSWETSPGQVGCWLKALAGMQVCTCV